MNEYKLILKIILFKTYLNQIIKHQQVFISVIIFYPKH